MLPARRPRAAGSSSGLRERLDDGLRPDEEAARARRALAMPTKPRWGGTAGEPPQLDRPRSLALEVDLPEQSLIMESSGRLFRLLVSR